MNINPGVAGGGSIDTLNIASDTVLAGAVVLPD